MEKQRIAVFVTGGIAAYKTPLLVRALVKAGHEVRVAMTRAAQRFVTPETLAIVSKAPVLTDGAEFEHPEHVAHVELARWADVGVVAPATANTVAKLAYGLADNVVTTTLLAMSAPKVLVPAMNDQMWRNPQTQSNIESLANVQGYRVLPPEEGLLAEGYAALGRMPEPESIARFIECMDEPRLQGKRIIVTAGGTKERLDPVRYLTNDSSGKMGQALACAAAGAGAAVTLIATKPLAVVPGVRVKLVESAQDMAAAVEGEFAQADAVIMAAAVADYRALQVSAHKLKKTVMPPETLKTPSELNDEQHNMLTRAQAGAAPSGGLTLHLVQNPDILASLGARKTHQVVIGFAAETDDVIANAQRKLTAKHADMIVANYVDATHGFNADVNKVTLLRPGHEPLALPEMPKTQVAAAIIEQLARML